MFYSLTFFFFPFFFCHIILLFLLFSDDDDDDVYKRSNPVPLVVPVPVCAAAHGVDGDHVLDVGTECLLGADGASGVH